MGAEKLQRPRTEAPGRRQEPGGVRQTAPADVDSVAPQPPDLMAAVRRRDTLRRALRPVPANTGAPGIDGRRVEALPDSLRKAWPTMRAQFLKATSPPAPVRAV